MHTLVNIVKIDGNRHQQPLAEVLTDLASSKEGLSQPEAARRLSHYGPNRLQTEKKAKALIIFLNQFKNFIVYLLLFAIFFALLIGEYVDSLIILAILIANSLIGFFQELSANRSLEALKKMSVVRARVLRDQSLRDMDSELVVLGDVIYLEAGNKVPADARIMEAVHLKVEESALTGESLAVAKSAGVVEGETGLGDRTNMLFSSTAVVAGNCRAVVTATGMATEIGKITTMLQETEAAMTPLQKKLDLFGRKVGWVILFICLIIFAISMGKEYLRGTISTHSLISFAFLGISLAVAAVPTALPAVVTIALSIGVKKLLHKKALVRRLASVETLGSCDVICTDKTGTLTQNQMTVRYAWTPTAEAELSGVGYTPEGDLSRPLTSLLFLTGRLCNNSSFYHSGERWEISGDPTEAALLVSAGKARLEPGREVGEKIDELPFDSNRKVMSVLYRDAQGCTIYTKGAPDAVLARCSHLLLNERPEPLTEEHRATILAQNRHYSDQALRVLGFAYRPLATAGQFAEEDLVFIGLQAMSDPPRPEVAHSLARTRQAGIRVIMITGDYLATAVAVGREVGITGQAVTGHEVEKMSDEELTESLRADTNIFARSAPEHKQRIVTALQRLGHVVAMTGDGVNDAPALKKADIGVAVGSGTDVAKEAADFVLLDDSFTHIVNAIEEGRGIYDNIQKSIMLLLSGNLGEVLIIFLAVLFSPNVPLTAILLLWINMVTNGAPALAYSVDPYDQAIMSRPPKAKNEGILPGRKLTLMCFMGVIGTAIALVLFDLYGGHSPEQGRLITAQTMVFNFVVLYEMILTLIIRLDYGVPFLANLWVWAAVIFSLLLQPVLMYTPLHLYFRITPLAAPELAILLGAGLCFSLFFFAYQRIFRRLAPAPGSGKKKG